MKRSRQWICVLGIGISAVLLASCADKTPQSQPQPSKTPAPVEQPKPAETSFAVRGVIEGFYGEPWTNKQREQMFSFMQKSHFNTYVYAPKDDPYQRLKWSELYPATQAVSMKSLIQKADSQHIRFVYSISPGLPAPLPGTDLTPEQQKAAITYTSKDDRAKLLYKIDQMVRLGAETVMLSFDDVFESLNRTDQNVYGADYARAQMELANEILQAEKKKEPNFQLWFAPTTYSGTKDNPYWKTLREKLDPSVQVIWTGPAILSKEITSEQTAQVAGFLGRKPLIWDNYPVNDYTYVVQKHPQLFMGPVEARSADLYQQAAGFLSNPMIQPEASKVALHTIGDYLNQPQTYDPQKSWMEAIQQTEGVGNAELFAKFCAYAQQSSLRKEGNQDFSKLAFSYQSASSVKGQEEQKLRKELEALRDLPKQLHASMTNQELLQEIDPWLTKLGQEGEAGLLALDILEGQKTQPGKQQGLKTQLQAKLKALDGNSLKIGEEVYDFAKQALQR